MKHGYEILSDPFLNKGTAFTMEERERLGLVGLLPPHVQTIEEQADQAYKAYSAQESDVARRHYLMDVFSRNRTLFYYLFSQHVEEFMPIVYDPTIAQDIEEYGKAYLEPQHAVYLSIDRDDDIEDVLRRAADGRDIDLIVVTDAGAILGIGDWGTNGVEISVGKLMVYTAAAGIDPRRVLPVVLDAGTDRESLLNDPLYLGNRHKRVHGDELLAFVDRFVKAAEKAFGYFYLHFEDFGRDHAARILERYIDKRPTFNDDIEGTGIITLAGVLGALQISGERLVDQVYVCFGAGTAGVGIANRVMGEFVAQGLSEDEARSRFYLVDRQGLLFDDMDDLTPEQKPFARSRSEFADGADLTTLAAVVGAVHPTILVGTSTVHGAFTEGIIREMAAHAKRPIIFPLSNPTKLAEATAADLIRWTDGRGLVATGIPSDPVEHEGVTYEIGQANNALIYPGLGLGVLAVHASLLTDAMILRAAHSLGGLVDTTKPGAAVITPVSLLNTFSNTVATAVATQAVADGLNAAGEADAEVAVKAARWEPRYE